jgi:uncharacterized protein YjbJ (UPF0337 family)
MNWDIAEGRWKRINGRLRAQWSRLTGDRLGVIAGMRAESAGRMQEGFGLTTREVEQRLRRLGARNKS